MATARLIDDLVADMAPVRPVPLARLGALVALVVAVQGAVAFALGEVRGDLATGAPPAILVWRILASAALAAMGVAMALRLRSPTRTPDGWPAAALAVALAAIAAGWALDLTYPSPLLPVARVRLLTGLHCIAVVTLNGLPVLAVLVVLLRRGATVRPEAAATGAGLAAAASGGFVWALACPIDDPAYATLWYAAAFVLITGAARLWLPRIVRLRPRCPTRETLRRRLLGR